MAELINSSLSFGFGTNNNDVVKVGDRGNNSSGQLNLVVGFSEVEDIVSCSVLLFDEPVHSVGDAFSTQMNLSTQKSEDISLFSG